MSERGAYAHTYEEPDTSAWKRKRVRLPDGRYGHRVIRPVLEGPLEDLRAGALPTGALPTGGRPIGGRPGPSSPTSTG